MLIVFCKGAIMSNPLCKIFLDVFEPVHCCGIFGFKFRSVHFGIALYVVNAHLDGSRKSALVVAFHP